MFNPTNFSDFFLEKNSVFFFPKCPYSKFFLYIFVEGREANCDSVLQRFFKVTEGIKCNFYLGE